MSSHYQKKITCSKGKRGETLYRKIIKMFIHFEYSLQVEIHHCYNEVEDTTLLIDTRVVYILRPPRLQDLSMSRSGRPAKRGCMS